MISELSRLEQVWRPKHRLVEALQAFNRRSPDLEYSIVSASLFMRSFEDSKGPLGDALFQHAAPDDDIPRWTPIEIAYMRQQAKDFRSARRNAMPAPVGKIPDLMRSLSEESSPPISEELRERARDLLAFFRSYLMKQQAMIDCADKYIALCDQQLGSPKQAQPRWDRTKLAAMRGLADEFSFARFGRVVRRA